MDNYLKVAFEELYNEDGLCVMAKGIGLERLFFKYVLGYSDHQEKKVTFCLNTTEDDNWLLDSFHAEGVQSKDFPKVINRYCLS